MRLRRLIDIAMIYFLFLGREPWTRHAAPARCERPGSACAGFRGGRAGFHEAKWDGKDSAGRLVPAGMYFYELTAAGERTSRRVIRLP